MDVGGQASVELLAEVLDHVEGRVEGANVPSPGAGDDVHQPLYDLAWGEGQDTNTLRMVPPADGGDQKPGGKEAANRLPVLQRYSSHARLWSASGAAQSNPTRDI